MTDKPEALNEGELGEEEVQDQIAKLQAYF
jgi:hypothetical protein